MAFDMHTHSYFSDGTTSPAEVIKAAARTGLSGVALTDHDTTAGWDPAEEAAAQHGIALIRGMELSTVSDDGVAVHVLSYLHDPTNIDLLAEIAKSRNARYKRAKKMAALLAEDFPITWNWSSNKQVLNLPLGGHILLMLWYKLGQYPTGQRPLTPFCGVAQNTMCPIMHRIPLPALSLSVLPGEYRSLLTPWPKFEDEWLKTSCFTRCSTLG